LEEIHAPLATHHWPIYRLVSLLIPTYNKHMKLTDEFRSTLFTLVASIVSGAIAGAIAGWSFASLPVSPYDRSPLLVESGTEATEEVEPEVEVVAIDRQSLPPIVPPAFAERRSSSAAEVYRRVLGTNVLSQSQMLGQAVAVTSDGWFVTPLAVVDGMVLSDIVLWHDGVSAIPDRGIVDERSSVVFLKTSLGNLTAPRFARYQEVSNGLAVWVERHSGSYEPLSVASLAEEVSELQGVSSRTAARAPSLSGLAETGDFGAPVWENGGSLIGLVSTAPGNRITYIPASAWAPSLFGIFSEGVITHAALGVSTVDLAGVRFVERDPNLPDRGAWILPDERLGIPGVLEGSPAEAAGLREGDVIQRVDRDILDGSADLGEVLVQYKPGSHVTLTVIREGETLEVPVTLGSELVSREMK
jgi:S1-C subfamily serine protease